MHELGNSPTSVTLRVVIETRTTRRDAALGRDAGHLRHHQRSPAHGAGTKMHQMVVAGDTVDRRILSHWRNHHTVLQRHAAYGEWREHRRDGTLAATTDIKPPALRDPVFKLGQIGRLA